MAEYGNVPLCEDCWEEVYDRPGTAPETDTAPFQVRESKTEQCDRCGKDTQLGIYVRKQTTHDIPVNREEASVLAYHLGSDSSPELVRKINEAVAALGYPS